ncbi:MAG: HEAT repeat domain-containing protein [Elusimicrobia bacterium]|nr:HEAT repeat domain-containing protein [Elusimicrobiota bacterium]
MRKSFFIPAFVGMVFAVFVSQGMAQQMGIGLSTGQAGVQSTPKNPATVSKPAPAPAPAVSQPKPVDYYQMLKSTEAVKRRIAVDNIGRQRNQNDISILIDVLSDTDSGVKIAACDSLGLMRAQQAADKIISLLDDKEPQVRQSACVALGYIGDPKAQTGLIERVKNDPDNSVKMQAILILGNMRASGAVDSLIPLLKDKNPDIRLMSAQALGKIGDVKAAPAIKDALLVSAEEMKTDAVLKEPYHLGQYKRLVTTQISALGELKDKSSEPNIEELLKSDDKNIKIAAASSLGKLGNKSGLSVAIKLVNDKDVQIQAIETLGNIGDASAISVLEKIFNTETSNNIKESARTALYKLGWKPPLPKPVKKEMKK